MPHQTTSPFQPVTRLLFTLIPFTAVACHAPSTPPPSSAAQTDAHIAAPAQGPVKLVAGLGNSVQQGRRREQELQAAIDAQNRRLLELKDFRIEMAGMTRDIEVAQRSYDTVLGRYMNAKIDASAKQANVMLLAPASEPLEPVHPGRAPFGVANPIFVSP